MIVGEVEFHIILPKVQNAVVYENSRPMNLKYSEGISAQAELQFRTALLFGRLQ